MTDGGLPPSDPHDQTPEALPPPASLLSGRRSAPLADRLRGPWRVEVAEASMLPSIAPGDWLLVDPLVTTWPPRRSIVVFRQPDTAELAIKRVAAGPGEEVTFAEGILRLGPDEAWLVSDASEEIAAAAGFGAPIDSRRYGPVPVELLVGRAWFRYAPVGRFGPLR